MAMVLPSPNPSGREIQFAIICGVYGAIAGLFVGIGIGITAWLVESAIRTIANRDSQPE